MELVFRLPEATRVALVGKNPVGTGGTQYCRICRTHGSVHGKAGSHKCNEANSQLQDGTVRANLHEPILVGTVVAREFLAMMACQYGGTHSGPYYPTAEDRQAAHNSFMRGPATVKCGGGALVSSQMRDAHPILPLERTADGGLGRMISANGMQPGDVYRSDERGLEEVVSDEVDAAWAFSDHSLAAPDGLGVARALSTRDADALVVHVLARPSRTRSTPAATASGSARARSWATQRTGRRRRRRRARRSWALGRSRMRACITFSRKACAHKASWP